MTIHYNYKSDFEFVLKVTQNGTDIGFPAFPFEAYVYTREIGKKFKASFDNLCYSYGVQYVGLTRAASYSLVSVLGKVESLVYDFDVLPVVGTEVSVLQFLVFFFYVCLFFRGVLNQVLCILFHLQSCVFVTNI
jgi:hypothetical protein